MKKIILGVLSVVATVAVVSGSAFALFSDTATVSGVTLSSSNADLRIETDVPNIHDSVDNLDLSSFTIPKLYPGMPVVQGSLWLQNHSTSAFKLHVTGQLTSAANWPNLSNAVKVKIASKPGYGPATPVDTGWKTLAEWNANPIDFPTDIPAPADMPNQHWGYDVYMMVDPAAGNEIANLSLNNIVFTLTGTQVNP